MQLFTLKKTTLCSLMLLITLGVFAQKNPSQFFSEFKTIQLPTSMLKTDLINQRSEQKFLQIGQWELTLFDSKIIGPRYQISTGDGNKAVSGKAMPMNGYTRTGGRVSITLNDGFVYGFIEDAGVVYNIEPLHYYDDAAGNDQFIVYPNHAILDKTEKKCGVTERQRLSHDLEHQHEHGQNRVGQCLEVEYAIGSDFEMFQKYGSVTAVENHNIGVTNDVQTNYDDEFADELQLVITEQFIATSNSADPWTNSLDAGTVLDDFTDWANGPGGFSFPHDIGSLWTARDFNGGTVGIAWLGAVCSSIRYNALSDFTSNANFLRVMTSHEIGHNFDANHDASGSPHIMAPSVQNTSSWSTASINAIEDFYNSIGCLDGCSSGVAPTGSFTYQIIENCTPGEVEFTDQSTGTITSWFWEFPGGSPSTSTQQNPVVTYATAGIYSATLTVSNSAGQDEFEIINEIEIIPTPQADLDYLVNGNVVEFFNLSVTGGISSTFWDFGDGSTSTQENPVHTYVEDGTYTVNLIIDNECGISAVQTTIVIATPPTASFSANNISGCGPLTVQFINNSSSNSQSYLWNFPGGSPSTSTLQNPIVIYNDAGNFDVTLTVTNPQGNNQLIKTAYISVALPPAAGFNYLATGTTVNFTNTSNNATTYAWNFGDGNNSSEPNPVHTYAATGAYTVTLIADNAFCEPDTIIQNILATAAPVSSFTVNSNTGCEVFTAQFTNLSLNNPTSFLWNFEGGNPATSTEANPVVTYALAGTYDVQLITSNSFGNDTLTLLNYITVNTIPNPSFTQSSNELVFNFTNTSIGATTFLWNFGDGNTSTEENPVHTYATEGNYNVSLMAGNDCGNVSIPGNAIAALVPVATFSQDNNTICPAGQIQYTDNSSGFGITREWTFQGGTPASSSEANPLVTYSASGTYTTTLIVTNVSGSDTIVVNNSVTVNPLPTAAFVPTTNGLEISVTNSSTNAISYLWTLPDGTTSNEENVSFTATQNGNYTFVLVATNACGNNTFMSVVNLNSLPVAEFSSDLSGSVSCSPISVQYNALPNQGASYAWSFEGGNPATSTEANPLVNYPDSGSYDVTLIVSNALGADTITFSDYVNLTDKALANYSYVSNEGTVNFTYTGESPADLLWDFGGLGTSTEVNPSFTFTTSGLYPVTLISQNLCGKDTIIQNIEVVVLSSDDIDFGSVKLYPNPANDKISIDFGIKGANNIDLAIFDILGREVYKTELKSIKNTFGIAVNSWPSGQYMVKITSGKNVITYKIIKE